jgi:hypothetical protein
VNLAEDLVKRVRLLDAKVQRKQNEEEKEEKE